MYRSEEILIKAASGWYIQQTSSTNYLLRTSNNHGFIPLHNHHHQAIIKSLIFVNNIFSSWFITLYHHHAILLDLGTYYRRGVCTPQLSNDPLVHCHLAQRPPALRKMVLHLHKHIVQCHQ